MLMPPMAVDSLVTFGSPPAFSIPEGILPFPHTHVQHCHDIVPHCFNARNTAAIVARLQGLGYLFPSPPYARLAQFKSGPKRDAIFDHPTNHVNVLYPTSGSYTASNIAFLVDGAGNTVMPSASTAPRNHQREASPLLEHEGKTTVFDVRTMHPTVLLRDYLLSVRLIVGKKIDIPLVTRLPLAFEVLCKYVGPTGELLTTKQAAELLQLLPGATTTSPTSPSPTVDLSQLQTSPNRKSPPPQKSPKEGEIVPQKKKKAASAVRMPLSPIEIAFLRAPKLLVAFLEQRQAGDINVKLPPFDTPFPAINVVTHLQLAGDSPENIASFFKQFTSLSCWEPRLCARQLIEWGGYPPLLHNVAQTFIQGNSLLFACSTPPRRAPLSRHLATAQAAEHMEASVRDMIYDPDGFHVGWSVVIASTIHGVGKSTLINALKQERLQSSAMSRPEKKVALRPSTFGDSNTPEGSVERQRMSEKDLAVWESFADPMMKVKWAPQIQEKIAQVSDGSYGCRKTVVVGAAGGPDSLMLKVGLNELFWNRSSIACRHTLTSAAMSIWLVSDEYSLDRLLHHVDFRWRKAGGDIPDGTQAAIVYSIRKGGRPNPKLEVEIANACAKYHLLSASVDTYDVKSIASLQRLIVQWMIPQLNLPIDPALLPPKVDLGKLVTKVDSSIVDYLKRTLNTERVSLWEDGKDHQGGGADEFPSSPTRTDEGATVSILEDEMAYLKSSIPSMRLEKSASSFKLDKSTGQLDQGGDAASVGDSAPPDLAAEQTVAPSSPTG